MLVSLSTLLHGSLEEKLSWTFRLYDLNHDGSITKAEIAAVVVAVYELLGVECAELVSSTVPFLLTEIGAHGENLFYAIKTQPKARKMPNERVIYFVPFL